MGKVMIAVTLVCTILFLLVPIFVSAAMSFDARPYLGRFPPPDFSLQWYSKFFSDSYYMSGLRTSLLLASLTAFLSTWVGGLAAIALHRYRFPGSIMLTSLFLAPLIIPQVIIGFALLFWFSTIGLSNGFLRLLIGHVVITIPYTIRATLAGLKGIPSSLVSAALSLGANDRQAFWDVTFPLAKTGIVVGSIFAFAFSLDDVAVTLFLADPENYTLPVALISNMRAKFDLTLAAAAVCLIGATGALVFILDRLVGLDKLIGQGVYRA